MIKKYCGHCGGHLKKGYVPDPAVQNFLKNVKDGDPKYTKLFKDLQFNFTHISSSYNSAKTAMEDLLRLINKPGHSGTTRESLTSALSQVAKKVHSLQDLAGDTSTWEYIHSLSDYMRHLTFVTEPVNKPRERF